MKTINVVKGPQNVPAIILGCMRMPALDVTDAAGMIRTAWEEGINFFDHADIYGDGKCEELFGNYLSKHPEDREKMFIQSKCGSGKDTLIFLMNISSDQLKKY